MTFTVDSRSRRVPSRAAGRPRWAVLAHVVAAIWSLAYLGLGVAWLTGAGGNPADPLVDPAPGLSLIALWGPQPGAAMVTGLAATGLLLTSALASMHPGLGRVGARPRPLHRVVPALAVVLGLVLAVVLPDFRLLATVAYTPILLVMALFGTLPQDVVLWPWPVVNMAVMSLAGLAWMVMGVVHHRRLAGACTACGRGQREPAWATRDAAARWGRLAVAVAVAVPLGYAVTRFAWALGIPLGITPQLLDDLGDGVYAGAGLATLAVGGAVLTLGLVQRWGEVFPRWTPGLRGQIVPVGLAVVPASIVSVIVASAGVMFVRFGVTGEFGDTFPGGNHDIAAWLPEMFWPLWAVALAAAAYAYWLRRRGTCRHCGRG